MEIVLTGLAFLGKVAGFPLAILPVMELNRSGTCRQVAPPLIRQLYRVLALDRCSFGEEKWAGFYGNLGRDGGKSLALSETLAGGEPFRLFRRAVRRRSHHFTTLGTSDEPSDASRQGSFCRTGYAGMH